VLLHDALDMLSTNTDDALVILIRHMERDRCRHFLLYECKALLHRLVGCSHDINVEVVLVETIEDNLNIALSHYFVDFTVLLATDKFFMLVGKLDLDTNLILRLRSKLHLRDNLKSRFNCIIRASNSEVKLVEAEIGIRVSADIDKHALDVVGVGKLSGIGMLDEPACTVELASL
jgi:hypothetical protein